MQSGSVIHLDSHCAVAAVTLPEHFTATHERCTVWVSPKGDPSAGVVVSPFALDHEFVRESQDPDSSYFDFDVGGRRWRLVTPDVTEPSSQSFMAILVLGHVAVGVYGSDLGWKKEDLRRFLEGIQLREE